MTTPTFADWLNESMRQFGFTKADLSRKTGADPVQVGRWCKGEALPSRRYLTELASVFGVSRATLDRLTDVSPSSTADSHAVDLERERWGAWYQHLLDSQVPRRMWESYTKACEALAAHWARLPVPDPSPVIPPTGESVSTPSDDGRQTDGPSEHGPLTAEDRPPRGRFPRVNRSVLSAAAS